MKKKADKSMGDRSNEIASKGSLTKATGRGAFYQLSGGFTQTLIRIGASTILARLLIPEDFGLFGMALLLGEFILRIGSLGMGVGIIAKRDVSEKDLSTAFWTTACLRIIMFIAAFGVAPIFALYFDDHRLTNVIRIISFTFLFQIAGVIGNALLLKKLKFASIFVVNITSTLLESSIALALVLLYSRSYWALVTAYVSASLWQNIFILILSRWTPKLVFSKTSFHFLFRFGINTLGESITQYLRDNVDYLLVGKILGVKILGFYEFAYRIPSLLETRISLPLSQILYPALAKVKESDEKLISGYLKGVRYIALICFPALGGLIVIAEVAVGVLWGNQWLTIVFPLQILCLSIAIKCSANPVKYLFLCKDRPDIPLKFSAISLCITFVSVGIFGYFFHVEGVAFGMLVSTLPNLYFVSMGFKMLKSPLIYLIKAILPIILSSLMTMVMTYMTITFLKYLNIPSLITMLCAIFVGAATYIIILKFIFKDTFSEIVETLYIVVGVDKAN